MPAEASIVPGTVFNLGFWVDVKERAFLITALTCKENRAPSQYKDRLIYVLAISMLKIRRPLGRLIFNMGIAIPGKTVFLIETAPSLIGHVTLMAITGTTTLMLPLNP